MTARTSDYQSSLERGKSAERVIALIFLDAALLLDTGEYKIAVIVLGESKYITMTTIINAPGSANGSDNSALGFILGMITVLVIVLIVVLYVIPRVRNKNSDSDVNVKVNLPASETTQPEY